MKKIFIFFILCAVSTCMIGCKHQEGPFDETKCIIEGTLMSDANPCISFECLPGMGLWIETQNKSYVIEDYWYSVPEEFHMGESIVREGDYIKAYGTERAYKDYKGDVFYEISLDSILLLIPREERKDTIEGTICGTLFIESNGQSVTIEQYYIKKHNYTFNATTKCINIIDEEFCYHEDFTYDEVEARGTIYKSYDNTYGFLYCEIDIKEIRRL